MKPLILMYHRVADLGGVERYTISPAQFSRQMRYLFEHDYNVVNLSTLLNWFAGNTSLAERSVLVTFDDGFLDTYEHACPVLRQYGFTATFFVVAGLLGKDNSWMTAHGYKSTPLVGWREVEQIQRDNFEVGSHTVNHRDLTNISFAEAKEEIEDSKRILEDHLGMAVKFFAYPYGRFGEVERQIVQDAGYSAACATSPGFIIPNADHYQLNRVEVAGTDSLRAFVRKVKFGSNKFTYRDLIRYYAHRAAVKVQHN